MIEALGGRKVLIVCGAVLAGVALVCWKGDVPTNFLTLLQWAVGLFMLGNGVEHAAAAYGTPEAVPGPDHSADLGQLKEAAADHGAEVAAVSSKLDELKVATGLTNQSLSLIIHKYGIDRMP